MTGTNIIQVMGTNIITNWPHASVVTNLNADRVDGKHAEDIVAIATNKMKETDPQVADNIANNYIPRWNSATTQLVSGNIYNNPANGRIGIGTTNPGAKLDINPGTVAADTQVLRIEGIGNYNAFGLGIKSDGYAGFLATQGSDLYIQAGKGVSTENHDIFFYTSQMGSADQQRMTIKGAGNVGIGTPSPAAKLDVNGDTRAASYYDRDDPSFYLDPAGTSYLRDLRANIFYDRENPGYYVDPAGSSKLLNLSVAGNVGIGTPAPELKLDVNGHTVIRGQLYLSSGGHDAIQSSYGPFLALNSGQYYGPTTVLVPPSAGFIVARSDNLGPNMEVKDNGNVIANAFTVRSDDRIKFNEQKLEYGLAQVMALETWRYDRAEWEYDPETEEIVIHPEKTRNEIGLLAQEVQKVIPEAVGVPENENSELWGISYATIIPVLVKAIQEQQSEIESLKQRIETLEQK